jgi:hypothetical protein
LASRTKRHARASSSEGIYKDTSPSAHHLPSRIADDCRVLRMADALPSAGLIKLHLGVTNQGKSQPQQQSGGDKQCAKGSRNCFECCLSLLSGLSIGNITLTPGALSLRADELDFDASAIQPFGAFGAHHLNALSPGQLSELSPPLHGHPVLRP